MARARREDLVARYAKDYPSAVACFEEDFELRQRNARAVKAEEKSSQIASTPRT